MNWGKCGNMEIEYIRKLTSSHMVVKQIAQLSDWEEGMIAHSAGNHLLFGKSICEDEDTRLWYDITGKQSLDVILETKELQYEFFCELLLEITKVVERLESILLVPDGLLLLPECIFRDYRTQSLFFCYYPGNTQQLPAAFGQLLEYLLTRLDHGDERAVTLAYDIYERYTKGEGIGAWRELLCIPYEQERGAEEETGRVTAETGQMRKEEREEIDTAEESTQESTLQRTAVSQSAAGSKKRMRLSAASFIPILEKCGIINGSIRLFEKRKTPKPQKIKRAEREKEDSFIFEPEEEEEKIQERPTVLLGGMALKPEGILRYEGRGACGDVKITGEVCVIGSEPGCDGYIPSTTVSRKHARITQKDGIYFIEDLNSSNGTNVGGELLNYKTKMSLQKNEVVVFADEKFRFI